MFLTIFVGVLVVYILHVIYFKLGTPASVNGENNVPWMVYWPRWLGYTILVKWDQYSRPIRLNNYEPSGLFYSSCGVVPTESECQLESPKHLITDRHEDGMLLWGGDQDGRMVVAKVVRQSRRRANVVLVVRDAKGQLYTIPNQPDTNVQNVANEGKWVGNGLLLECVEPMRTWRLKYAGFLRKGVRDEYITDDALDDDDDVDTPIFFGRIDFLWKAIKAPIDVWSKSSAGLLADALTRESGIDSSLFRTLERDGYDQWGVLHGTLKIGDDDEQQWYLRGARQHRWGMSDSATNLKKCVNFFSYFETGDAAWTEAFSYDSGISHCVMGYCQTAAGAYDPFTSTTIELGEIDLDLKGDSGSKNFLLEFKAGGKKQLHWHHFLDKGCRVHTGDPWTLRHNLHVSYVASKQSQGWGLVLMTSRFPGLCPVPEREMIPSLLPSITNRKENDLVVQLTAEECKLPSVSGGKGASLALLISMRPLDEDVQFSVPGGVVVSSTAWKYQVNQCTELKASLTSLEKAITSSQISLVKEACQRIVSFMKSMEVCEEIKECLQKELNQAFPEGFHDLRFAVRSSACCEDSEEASSAGQNDTFLGCRWAESKKDCVVNKEGVAEALVACWASQFSFQSVEYRRQRGQPLDGGMGVVVQQMVAADAAGVVFTRNPLNGDPSSITVTVNYGLGESVVSGTSEPDSFDIQRTWRDKLSIRSKTIGDKKIQCIMTGKGSTKNVDTAPEQAEHFCISDMLAIKISKVSIYIEKAFGSPRDIEFAVKGENVHILQARPITSLFEWTDYEIIHELDSPIISDSEIHTVANTGEVFPGYTTPLTLTLTGKCLDLSLQDKLAGTELPSFQVDPAPCRHVAIAYSRLMLNVGELIYRGVDEEISMGNYSADLAVFGHVVTTPKIHHWAKKRYWVLNKFTTAIKLLPEVYGILFNGRLVKNQRRLFSNYVIESSKALSAAAMYKRICSRIPDMLKICSTHGRTSSASLITQLIAMITLTEGRKEVTDELIQDIALLFASICQTETAEVPTAIKKLASVIAASSEASEFITMSTDEARVLLESDPGPAGRRFRAFVEKHGHRCIKEFDFRSLSWGLSSTSLVAALQKMVENPTSFEEQAEKMDLEEVLTLLKSPIKPSTKRALRFVLSYCADAVSLREATKSMLIKTVDGFRRAYRSLGVLMVSECRLPDSDLLFFLHHREIELLLTNGSPTIIHKALKRRRLMKQLDAMDFDEIMFGVPKPVNYDDVSSFQASSDVVKGTPVCHGVATGTARIVTKLEEAHLIQNGDILVTYCTDVGWTPYFPLLSGIITEIGGLISHGAVVAREYGLPSVIGVKGATRIFNSGELIRVNGGQGTIERLRGSQIEEDEKEEEEKEEEVEVNQEEEETEEADEKKSKEDT